MEASSWAAEENTFTWKAAAAFSSMKDCSRDFVSWASFLLSSHIAIRIIFSACLL